MFDDAATAFVEQSLEKLRTIQVLDILDSVCAIEQAMLPRVHDHSPQITIDYKDRIVSEAYATKLKSELKQEFERKGFDGPLRSQ